MKHLKTHKEYNIFAGVGIGIVLSILVMLGFGAIGAWLISDEKMDITFISWIAIIIQAAGGFIGTFVSLLLVKEKLAVTTGINIAVLSLILLCVGMLVFDGISAGILTGIASIAVGGAVACIIRLKPKSGKFKKRKMHFR